MRRTNTYFGWCAEPAQRGSFVFPLLPVCFCRAVQADFVRRLLSVPVALCARRFVCFLLCAWSETVSLKVNTSVGEFSTVPGSDLESIPCLGNSLTKSEQSLLRDQHDARIVAQGLKMQEIKRVVFAESRVGKTRCLVFVFCSCTHIHPRFLLLRHLVVRIDRVAISPLRLNRDVCQLRHRLGCSSSELQEKMPAEWTVAHDAVRALEKI